MIRYHLFFFIFISISFCFAQNVIYYEGLTSFKIIKNTHTLYGFKNAKEQIIIPARYDSIVAPFRYGRSIVTLNKDYGVIDNKHNIIIPFEFKDILPEQYSLTPVKNINGLWGFYSYAGIQTIPCTYDNFRFSPKGNYILVQKDGKWGIITTTDKLICRFEYKAIDIISNNQYRMIRYDNWEHKTIKGEIMASYEYDSVGFTNLHSLTYTMNGWKGLINEYGAILIQNKFTNIKELNNELVAIELNGLWGIKKHNTAEWLLNPLYNYIRIDQTLIYAGISFGNPIPVHWTCYNHSGVKINSETFTDFKNIANDMIAVKVLNGKWGFMNPLGKLVIQPLYNFAEDFRNGLSYVEINQEKYIINKTGDVVLNGQDVNLYHLGLLKLDAFQHKKYVYQPDIYTELIPVDSFFIKVRQNNKYGLINRNGETVLNSIYSEIKTGDSKTTFSVLLNSQWKVIQAGVGTFTVDKKIKSLNSFYDGYAMFLYNNGEYGFIDTEGRIRVAPQYTKALPFQNGVAAIQLNGKWGFISKEERLIAQPYYESVSPFVNNVSIVKENAVYYLMDINGKVLTNEGYEHIYPTANGNYLLVKNKLYGIANEYGKEIISPRYQFIEEFSSALFKVKADNLFGVIDINQKIILHFKYKDILFNISTNTFLTCEENINMFIKTK